MRLPFGRRKPASEPRDSDRDVEIARARAAMVADQLERRGIRDARVLEIMGTVPREVFVRGVAPANAYDDRALPIDVGQTISQPYMVARMAELLAIEAGDRILEVGTGSGYQAAVLARLGASVTSIERHAELAAGAREGLAAAGIEAVEIRLGDGSRGDAGGAPWDGIIVTAGAPMIPNELRDQLAVGARLVIPVGSRERQVLVIVERRGPTDWQEWSDGPVVFVPLVGDGGWDE